MVSCIGNLGKVSIAGRDLCTNQQINSLVPSSKIDSAYLFRAANRLGPQLLKASSSTTVPIVNKSSFQKLRIPLPPLEEQRRIAAILDKADELRTKRREAIAKLDTLAQSIFIDMFGDPMSIGGDQHSEPFNSVTRRITYGFTNPMSHLDSGVPILTAKNIRDGFIDFDNVHYADKSEFDQLTAKSKPSLGDVLITKDGTIGRCAVVEREDPLCINQSVALVQPDKAMANSVFIVGYLRLDSVQRRLKNMGKGNALAHLQITELAQFPLVIPPMDDQLRFAERVREISFHRNHFQRSASDCETLFSSLQQRAFSGEL